MSETMLLQSGLSATRFCLYLGLVFIAGCSKYQLTLNENVMYSPAPLFTQFTTADPNLKVCLDQAIKDSQATHASDVKRLVCTHAGVSSVEGLEVFSEITQLHLAHNQLQRIDAIGRLAKLEELSLSDNQLKKVPEILLLENLTMLDLSENAELACSDIAQFQRQHQIELHLPPQCEKL
jgi:Leucine-rich repeat (LRR) protein